MTQETGLEMELVREYVVKTEETETKHFLAFNVVFAVLKLLLPAVED